MVSQSSPGAPGLATSAPEVDRVLRALVEDPARPLASLSVLVVRAGEVVHEAHFGQRSIELGLNADTRTLYRIASISKVLTAMAVMQCVEAGQLSLDEDVGPKLGFALRHPAHPGEPITVRQLMSHTSSLRDPDDLLPFGPGQGLADVLAGAQAYRWWAPQPGQGPGAGWFHYANINQVVLGTVVERLAGRCFDELVRAQILGPLGMRGGFLPLRDLAPGEEQDLATLYRRDESGQWAPQGPDRTGVRTAPLLPLDGYVPGTNAGLFGPQGALRVSVAGLGRLMRMFLAGGALEGVRVLRGDTVRQMLEPQWCHDARPGCANGDTYGGLFREWGLGVQRFHALPGAPPGFAGVGHLGMAWGLLSGFVFDPALQGGVVYAMGGTSTEPDQYLGQASAFSRWEEVILETLLPLTVGVS